MTLSSWRLSDYCHILDDQLIILVVKVGHRRLVYKD